MLVDVTDERELVEAAAVALLADVPPGWEHLHAEFGPDGQGSASMTIGGGTAQPFEVPARAVAAVAEHHRRAVATGAAWTRLVIDCHHDGRLAAQMESAVLPTRAAQWRWLVPVLAAVTVGCLTAAGVVFASGWRWGPPPRIGVVTVPEPSARQQEAFAVIQQWQRAENDADTAALRALACATPGPSVQRWLDTLDGVGQHQALLFADAITKFDDQGTRLLATVAVRVRPLNDAARAEVEEAQNDGGFFDDDFTLADEAGQLKVCDVSMEPF